MRLSQMIEELKLSKRRHASAPGWPRAWPLAKQDFIQNFARALERLAQEIARVHDAASRVPEPGPKDLLEELRSLRFRVRQLQLALEVYQQEDEPAWDRFRFKAEARGAELHRELRNATEKLRRLRSSDGGADRKPPQTVTGSKLRESRGRSS